MSYPNRDALLHSAGTATLPAAVIGALMQGIDDSHATPNLPHFVGFLELTPDQLLALGFPTMAEMASHLTQPT